MEDERMEQQNPDTEPELFIPEAGHAEEEESMLLYILALPKMGLKSHRQDVYSPELTGYLYGHSDSRQVNGANGALVID
ncbi:hypothetical protein N7522_004970 [Penicillium canescens]|nr:hypothetical protein N7522_004970 [Penicillium canescens]